MVHSSRVYLNFEIYICMYFLFLNDILWYNNNIYTLVFMVTKDDNRFNTIVFSVDIS